MMSRSHSNPVLRAGQGLFLGAVCAVFLFIIDGLDVFDALERNSLDTLFKARGIVYPSPNIVIVEADDSTIVRWPLPIPRGVYGELVDKLTQAGAKTIAFDVMFPRRSKSPDQDARLIASTQASGRVIHSAAFFFKPQQDLSIAVGNPANANLILPRFRIPTQGVMAPETVWGTAAMPELQKAAAGLGLVNAPPDVDGVLRQVPNILGFRGGDAPTLHPSLALAAAAHFLDIKPSQIVARPHEIVIPAASGTRHIPLDTAGRTWVNWIGPHHSFPTHSLTSVLDGRVPASEFKGKIVLIGLTAAGSTEIRPTPFSSIDAAVNLQANAINDILMNRSLHPASPLTKLLLLLIFPALIGAIAFRWNSKISGLATLMLCVALWCAALFALSRLNYYLPVANALAGGMLAWSVCIAVLQLEDARQLRRAEERYALAVRGANDGLWDWDLKTGEIYYSPRWKSMLGYGDDEIGAGIDEWYSRVHPDDLSRMKAQLSAHLSGGEAHFESQHRMKHRDRHWVWVLSRGLRVCDGAGKPTRMAGSQSDISEQIEANEQLERNAFYDGLTGLPNRALFMDLLGRALARTQRRKGHYFAVCFLDLDRFKTINDSLGHSNGDALLINVARRLESCLRPGDTAARLGGDEFTILLDDIIDAGDATRIVERIQSALSEPFTLGGQEIFSTSSIGIALSSPEYRNPEDLLRDADTAMYRAKSLGRARHAIFDEAMHAEALLSLRLETDLRRALERENFLVFYQPIVHLESGEISGFEALVRWQHAERGMISPGEFIPLAEETGLIIPLDHFVLREACTQVKLWQDLFPQRRLTISVNLSSKQFAQPDLIPHIQGVLKATGLSPESLKLEITEGVLMNNPDSAASMLHQLRDLGIRLSIDDFGTGYSSLSYLHRFPLNTLKVDQSFVRRMQPNGENSEIVLTIVNLARNLNMDVIAEGIETENQMEQLRDILCDYGQGYFFAKPLTSNDAHSLLSSNTNWSSRSLEAAEAIAVAV
ncbi:MAG: EAL domain-containing protein [Armatimonadetes bacterium]|nr:EAL domain-containing protein [Armatimonadota bacterium]